MASATVGSATTACQCLSPTGWRRGSYGRRRPGRRCGGTRGYPQGAGRGSGEEDPSRPDARRGRFSILRQINPDGHRLEAVISEQGTIEALILSLPAKALAVLRGVLLWASPSATQSRMLVDS